MQWEFRKCLESQEAYKKIESFKLQIEKGDGNTLDGVLREIELIISDQEEKMISKVMALRFLKDIMVFGKEDIIKKIQKLIPTLTKICSHQLNSTDPQRGATYFHSHPLYLKMATEEERTQADRIGSSYFILSLQSIYHWAKWIPLDTNGQESIYSKAYRSLIERGVVFPTFYHYYKQSDTDKFKNMYKMEFFTDSFCSQYSEQPSIDTSQQSDFHTNQENLKHKNIKEKASSAPHQPQTSSIISNQQKNISNQQLNILNSLNSVTEIMNYLNSLRKDPSNKRMQILSEIQKKLQNLREKQTASVNNSKSYVNSKLHSKISKQQKRWIDEYLINYGLLLNKNISYEQFLKRGISQQIELQDIQQEDISISKDYQNMSKNIVENNKFHKSSATKIIYGNGTDNKIGHASSPNKNISEYHPELAGSKVKSHQENILKKQQLEFKTKISSLNIQLEQKYAEIAVMKSNYEKEKNTIIENYQNRINIIKNQIKKGYQDKSAIEIEIQKENEKLKKKIIILEEEICALNYSSSRQKQLQIQRNQLYTQVQKLSIQNEKLTQIKNNKIHEKNQQNQERLTEIGTNLKEKEQTIEKLKIEIKRLEKHYQGSYDQANIFKSQLLNERVKNDQRILTLTKTIQQIQIENSSLKNQCYEFRKTLDLKEIEILSNKEEIKRYLMKLKDLNDRKSNNQFQTNIELNNNLSNSPAQQQNIGYSRARGLPIQSPNKMSLPETSYQNYQNQMKPNDNSKNQNAVNRNVQSLALRFNNNEDLFLHLKPQNKELFLRFCRSSFKKKDILFKDNQLEIGVITDIISENSLKFLLHFTNNSEKQILELKIEPEQSNNTKQKPSQQTFKYEIDNHNILCIPSLEQQKITVIVHNLESPFLKERPTLAIQYFKNEVQFNASIILPFTIIKFFNYYQPKSMKINDKSKNLHEVLQFRYSKKMIPKPNYLKSYFEQIEETSVNKFEMEAHHQETDLSLKVSFIFAPETQNLIFDIFILREKINEKQRYIFQQFVSFIEVAFKK